MSAPYSIFVRLWRLEKDGSLRPDTRETAGLARNALIDAERADCEARCVFAEHWPGVKAGDESKTSLADMVRELFALKNAVHEALTDARQELRDLRAEESDEGAT